jgi:hypothetical protein
LRREVDALRVELERGVIGHDGEVPLDSVGVAGLELGQGAVRGCNRVAAAERGHVAVAVARYGTS